MCIPNSAAFLPICKWVLPYIRVETKWLSLICADVCVCVCVCVCALSTDQIPEGIRELESLLDKRDLVVCAPLLLVHAHKRCKLVGQYSTIRCLLA